MAEQIASVINSEITKEGDLKLYLIVAVTNKDIVKLPLEYASPFILESCLYDGKISVDSFTDSDGNIIISSKLLVTAKLITGWFKYREGKK